jgi:hypothetical protein
MTESRTLKAVGGRKVEFNFEGGNVTSDAGLLILKAVESRCGLLQAVSKVVADPRDPCRVEHSVYSMLCQRVFGLCLGYEDLNDHTNLRHDIGFQTAADRAETLASPPTLCRMENWADRSVALKIHEVIIDQFIASFDEAPQELILDFDATDDRVHGKQAGGFFNAYYDHSVFLPLHVYCGDRLLVSYLRPGNCDAALHAGAILKLLVRRLRKAWPKVSLIFRADSGFCRSWLLSWCSRNDVHYIVGLAKNAVLNRMSEHWALKAQYGYEETGEKSRIIDTFFYAAGTWPEKRKVVARVEYGEKGIDQRYIVTNIKGNGRWLYEDLYSGRGDAENQIKETKNTLFSDRTSCIEWESNQFRLLLSTLAHTIMERIRTHGLSQPHSEFSKGNVIVEESEQNATNDVEEPANSTPRWSFESIRLRLLKIGAIITRSTRRVVFSLASGCPWQEMFSMTLSRFAT